MTLRIMGDPVLWACLGDALGFFSLTFFLPEHRAIKAISPSLLQLVRTSHVRSWKRQDTKKQTGAPAVQASVVRRQKVYKCQMSLRFC